MSKKYYTAAEVADIIIEDIPLGDTSDLESSDSDNEEFIHLDRIQAEQEITAVHIPQPEGEPNEIGSVVDEDSMSEYESSSSESYISEYESDVNAANTNSTTTNTNSTATASTDPTTANTNNEDDNLLSQMFLSVQMHLRTKIPMTWLMIGNGKRKRNKNFHPTFINLKVGTTSTI